MADIKKGILSSGGECGERSGKRGPRGHRGRDGHDGRGGLLKFSGVAEAALDVGVGPVVSYLTDAGVGFTGFSGAPNYPMAIKHKLHDLSTNVLPPFVVPPGGSIVIELLKNGVPIPGFIITYTGGGPTGGIQVVEAGPESFSAGDTFDLRVTTDGLQVEHVDMSATVGVE